MDKSSLIEVRLNHGSVLLTRSDYQGALREANKALAGYVAQGKLKYRESVLEGIENAPKGLVGLLKGQNFGKQLIRVAD